MTILSRRGFLTGLITAPAIIPITNLMRLSVPAPVYSTRTITLTEYAALLGDKAHSLYDLLAGTINDTVFYGIALTRYDGERFERYDHANKIWRSHVHT